MTVSIVVWIASETRGYFEYAGRKCVYCTRSVKVLVNGSDARYSGSAETSLRSLIWLAAMS